jgi:hypothetical protein
MTIPPFDSVRNFGAEEVTEQDLLMEKIQEVVMNGEED